MDRNSSIAQKLQSLCEVVHMQEPHMLLCFATPPPPWPMDGQRVTSRVSRAGAVVKAFCQSNQRLFFTKACNDLTWKGGLNTILTVPSGLSQTGCQLIARALNNKIRTGGLSSLLLPRGDHGGVRGRQGAGVYRV